MLCEGMWRNWYTRTIQNRIPKGLGVRVSPCPQMNEVSVVGMSDVPAHIAGETRKPEPCRFSDGEAGQEPLSILELCEQNT